MANTTPARTAELMIPTSGLPHTERDGIRTCLRIGNLRNHGLFLAQVVLEREVAHSLKIELPERDLVRRHTRESRPFGGGGSRQDAR